MKTSKLPQKSADYVIGQIAAKIKVLRMKAGYKSSETFAFDNDLPRVQYWRMEKGTNFTIKGLLRILAIHKITVEEFFKGVK